MINDISGVLSWEKVNSGLFKMYKVCFPLVYIVCILAQGSEHLTDLTVKSGRMPWKISNYAALFVRLNPDTRVVIYTADTTRAFCFTLFIVLHDAVAINQ